MWVWSSQVTFCFNPSCHSIAHRDLQVQLSAPFNKKIRNCSDQSCAICSALFFLEGTLCFFSLFKPKLLTFPEDWTCLLPLFNTKEECECLTILSIESYVKLLNIFLIWCLCLKQTVGYFMCTPSDYMSAADFSIVTCFILVFHCMYRRLQIFFFFL